MSSNQPRDLATQVSTSLLTRHSLAISPTWLAHFLSTTTDPPPPLPALTSTAHFRLLSSDFTLSLSSDALSHVFSAAISSPAVKQVILSSDVPVQLLDVWDISTSRGAQLETLERIERGEMVKGREIIRDVPDGEGAPATTASSSKSVGPHKLLLQDAAGTKVVAFERERIHGVGSGDEGMKIGLKMLLKRGAVVRRGCVVLKVNDVAVWGGGITAWDDLWRRERKGRLLRELERE